MLGMRAAPELHPTPEEQYRVLLFSVLGGREGGSFIHFFLPFFNGRTGDCTQDVVHAGHRLCP